MSEHTYTCSFMHGDEVKEPISGFLGVVESIAFWKYGCVRIGIRAKGLTKDGDIREVIYLDEPQLELVKAAFIPGIRPKVKKEKSALPAHGPRADEKRRYK